MFFRVSPTLQDWLSVSGSSWAFLHCPIAQVDGAASLLGEAAVARGRQLLGILLGRARHVRCVQAVHGANRPRLGGFRALDGVVDHHETCIIQERTPLTIMMESDKRKELLGGRRGTE